MEAVEMIALVEKLRGEPHEWEWLEFKANRCEPQEIGEYISALANSACLTGKSRGYLLFGIDNKTHEVIGTSYNPYTEKAKGNQNLLFWLSTGLKPSVGFETHVVNHSKGRVVLIEIKPAENCPVKFYNVAWIRVGESKTELSKYPDKERAIWMRRTDWSAQICGNAMLHDLDTDAIRMAREQLEIKNHHQAKEIARWDTITFLNKTGVTVQGAITNTAVLLLGKPETFTLLSPATAQISWILRDASNKDLDYEHFGPPIILQVNRVLSRIRNLTLRTLPSGTLFPQEINQYDPWVIREALHNSIAHQDYWLGGRINVVETPHDLHISNSGSFLPGEIETVIRSDAPPEIYRNPLLAHTMVKMNMIDTQGGGIKRMFETQVKRFFPLPDYDLSKPERVSVTIHGEILDEQYSRILMEKLDLDIWTVILLDKVQKRMQISKEEHRRLKSLGFVEGRYPNLMVAGPIARLTGQKARHIREKGFDRHFYMNMIEELIQQHGPVSRNDIDQFLLDKLPEVLNPEQKKNRIHNLLGELSNRGKITNTGSRRSPRWQATGIEETGILIKKSEKI